MIAQITQQRVLIIALIQLKWLPANARGQHCRNLLRISSVRRRPSRILVSIGPASAVSGTEVCQVHLPHRTPKITGIEQVLSAAMVRTALVSSRHLSQLTPHLSSGPGGVPPVGNQNIHATGFPHPSAAPMSTFLHTFPSQPAAPAPAAPAPAAPAPAAPAPAARAAAARAAAARTPASHASAAPGGVASHASAAPGGVASHTTAPVAAGVPDGSGASTAQDSATLPSADLPTPGPRGQPRDGAYETVFHPHARRDSVPTRLDYSQPIPLYDITHVNYEPWRPFATRTDYELAEFMLTSGLSRGQATTLFGILNRIAVDPKQLTVKSYDDVQKAWDSAASKQPAVCMISLYML